MGKIKKPSITKLKKKLWNLCREIILERQQDSFGNVRCFTCGRGPITGSNRQLSHFIPSSLCSVELRYDLSHLRYCCYHCNINLSGNWPAFRKNLIFEMGEKFPDELVKRNEETKGKLYDTEWYLNKISEYQILL